MFFGLLKAENINTVCQAVVSKGEKKGPNRSATQPRGEMEQMAIKTEEKQYYNPPKIPRNQEQKNPCPPWSGKGTLENESVTLTNTCTLDNLLHILHLILSRYPEVMVQVEAASGDDLWLQSLLDVHQHFLRIEWTQGRIAWLKNLHQFTAKTLWDCFGHENHFLVSSLSTMQMVKETSSCPKQDCAFTHIHKNESVLEIV